jgi:hypothetical protein
MSNSKPKKRSLSKQIEEAAKGVAVKPRKGFFDKNGGSHYDPYTGTG